MKLLQILLLLLPLQTIAADYLFVQDKGLEYSWQADDKVAITLGVQSYGYTEQLCFWASSTAGATRNQRSLYATGYSLKDATTYYAYCPYRYTGAFSATAVTFPYTAQQQKGNASTAALYAYDYRTATATTANGACTLNLQRIGCVIRIEAKAPAEAEYTLLQLTATNNEGKPQAVIPTGATANLLTAALTTTDNASNINMTLTDMSLKKDETMVAYIMLPAIDLSAYRLKLELKDNDGITTELATIKGFKTTAGYLYNIDLTNPATAKNAITSAAKTTTPALTEVATTIQATPHNALAAPPTLTAAVSNPIVSSADILLDPTFTLEVIPQQILGDVNNDGTVDMVDAIALNGYYLSGKTSTLSKAVCDLNNDGEIDIVDVIAIISKYLSGK